MPNRLPPLPDRSVEALIVDAHEATRLGLAVLLGRQAWVARCLQAPDMAAAQQLARRHRPDVAVLDVSNTGPFVASSTVVLREAHSGMQIVLTSRCPVQLPAAPRRLGAAAYVPPDGSGPSLVDAVRAALVAHEDLPDTPDSNAGRLTHGERELLLLISTGATNREIAAALHLGPDAVKKKASALYRKLGVRNRTEATKYAGWLLDRGPADSPAPSQVRG